MKLFWGNCDYRDYKRINNKSLILINYLSVIVPDVMFLIENKLSHKPLIPTISFINICVIKRFIHVFLWYWGFFYRMGKIVKPNTLYEKIYHVQLLTWAGANIFPLTKNGQELTDKLHYVSTSVNFISFSILKLLFCKNPKVFMYSFLGLIITVFGNYENSLNSGVAWNSWAGFFERCCVYSAIHITPRIDYSRQDK